MFRVITRRKFKGFDRRNNESFNQPTYRSWSGSQLDFKWKINQCIF